MLRDGMFIAERYEIIEKIGSGGMSEVYKAMDHKLNRYVAIKVLKSEFSEDKTFVSKFRAEAQSAAGLMHSNIVNVYDVGEEESLHYIVMELVEGITLKKYIERKGRLKIREAVSVAIQVAQGIEAAHKHHIVHRDIKPQNIIISKEGKVKVTDFGIARAASSNTINSAVMGSVHYISPEQARGGYSDEKSDIYSFGITLFEMLTGKVPFEGDSTVTVALMHIQDDMVSPKSLVPEIPISVEKIVLKCTQKKTERRYQSVSELIADLKRSLVTPDEDFVVIPTTISSDGPTRMLGEDEMIEIAQKSAVKATVSDLMPPQNDEEGSDVEDFNEDENDDWDEEEEDDTTSRHAKNDLEDEFDDEDDEESLGAPKKIDKIITIIGIAVAVAILVVTIIVIYTVWNGSQKNKPGQNGTKEDHTIETVAGVRVPNLIGKTQPEAESYLKDASFEGFRIVIGEPVADATAMVDTIVKQEPEAGSRVAQAGVITVHLCTGAETEKIPNVCGMKEEEARKELEAAGFVVEIGSKETTDKEKEGTVYQTNPVVTTAVEKGSTVTILIYELVEETEASYGIVPNVVGKTESEARKAIEKEGLIVADQDEDGKEYPIYKYSDKYEKDIVISQSGPEVDSKVEKGDKENAILLVISLGPEPKQTEPETEAPTNPPETEAPTNPPETAAPIMNYDVTTVIDSTKITEAITDVDTASITYAKAQFICNYTDAAGVASTKQIGAKEYQSYEEIKGNALPLTASENNVFFTEENIDPKAGATITIKVVYKFIQDEVEQEVTKEVTGIEASIVTR